MAGHLLLPEKQVLGNFDGYPPFQIIINETSF
jgi:hypothetical protein